MEVDFEAVGRGVEDGGLFRLRAALSFVVMSSISWEVKKGSQSRRARKSS